MKKIFCFMLTMIMLLSMSVMTFAATNDVVISDGEKKELYEQFQDAVQEAIEKYDARIELKPFEEFDFENTVSIDEFKATLKAIGESRWHNSPSKLNEFNALTPEEYEEKDKLVRTYSYQEVTKSDTVTAGTRTITINVTGQFETYYSDAHDRQLFSGGASITDISSTNASYTWHTNFLDKSIIDGGRTYAVAAQGYIEYSGMYWYNLDIRVEFYCSPNGQVS